MKLKENTESSKKRSVWSKTIEQDDERKHIRVKEAENGYVIEFEHDYEDKNGTHQFDQKTYISRKNPIKGDKGFTQEMNEDESLFDSIDI